MTTKQEWIYNFESNWPVRCEQPNQSPININPNVLTPCSDLCKLEIEYKPTNKCVVSFNQNQNLKIEYTEGSYVKFKDEYYSLKEITFHTPSLHAINNKKYDLEICFIHSNREDGKKGLMMSCLYQQGNFHGTEEIFINQFLSQLRINTTQEIEVSDDWNANMLLPEHKSFYLYEGSLPFPPCTEDYECLVFETIGNIGPINLDILYNNLGKNTRQLVPTNNRTIFYSSGDNYNVIEKKGKVSEDKILRCKPKKNIETTKKPKPTAPIIPKNSTVSFKKSMKTFFVIVFVILLVVLAFKTAKSLVQNGSAQKFIGLFVDNFIKSNSSNGTSLENISSIWKTECGR